MNLKEIETEELEKELRRRTEAKRAVPTKLAEPDFGDLVDICESYIRDIRDNDGVVDDDSEHYIFEAAVEAVYGEEVWDWINKHTE